MPSVDWYYHRPGCTTCGKSQAFLEKKKLDVKEQVNAAKIRFEPKQALELVRQANRVIVAKGKKVVCYFSAGSYEAWRPDAKEFPASVQGKSNGWKEEKWLDIRKINILKPIMKARIDLAQENPSQEREPGIGCR